MGLTEEVIEETKDMKMKNTLQATV